MPSDVDDLYTKSVFFCDLACFEGVRLRVAGDVLLFYDRCSFSF
jgi:hypothetical protein